MEKTFIQNLWEKKPDLVSQKIKEICNIDEEKGDKLQFSELKDGALKFSKQGHVSIFIVASDFAIRTSYSGNDYENSKLSKKWVNFMYSVYGNKYAMQYISKRNQQLDQFMADYEEKYNAKTVQMLDEMGFDYGKTK